MFRFSPDQLRYELARRGLSQTTAAKAAGLHRQTMVNACAGTQVHPYTVGKISALLDRIPPLAPSALIQRVPKATP